MTDNTSFGSVRWAKGPAIAPIAVWQMRGSRRCLQLARAALWLLDGPLQFQPYMFTKAFGAQVLATAAQGNPQVIARPITLVAGIAEHHPVSTNAAIATIQVPWASPAVQVRCPCEHVSREDPER